MKKYISVFELFVRSSFYKVLLILFGMVAVELVMFSYTLPMSVANSEYMVLEVVMEKTWIPQVFAAGFILITLSLGFSGFSTGCNQNYTLKRLQIKEWKIYLLQGLYNAICYFLFWLVQVVILLIICNLYCREAGNVTNQTAVLAFYRNAFMHSILPLGAAYRWVENIIMLVGCSVTSASFAVQRRKGKFDIALVIVVGICLVAFAKPLGEYSNTGLIWAILIWVIHGFYWMFKKECEDERGKKLVG